MINDAENMRKYMKLLSESVSEDISEPEVIVEAKPFSFWQQLMTRANITDGGKNERIDTGQMANEEYAEWKKYLGKMHKKEGATNSSNRPTTGDLYHFLHERGFHFDMIKKAFEDCDIDMDLTSQETMEKTADQALNNPKKVANVFLKAVINAKTVEGPKGRNNQVANASQKYANMKANRQGSTQQTQQTTQQQTTQAPAQQQTQPSNTGLGNATTAPPNPLPANTNTTQLTGQEIMQQIGKLSKKEQQALLLQLANATGTHVGGAGP